LSLDINGCSCRSAVGISWVNSGAVIYGKVVKHLTTSARLTGRARASSKFDCAGRVRGKESKSELGEHFAC
jgi:hypothetical protein